MTTTKNATGKRIILLPSDLSSPEARSLIASIVRNYLTLGDTEQLKFDIDMLYIEKENEYIDETVRHANDFNRTLRVEGLM